MNPQNHGVDSRNYTVNQRNHTDDLEMDVDKSQVHALRIALENAYAPFVSDLSKGES